MDRQMDMVNPEFYFVLKIINRYALLWTPNAYHTMANAYFYPLFIFQMHFEQFSMPIYAFTCLINSSGTPLLKAAFVQYYHNYYFYKRWAKYQTAKNYLS